MFIFISTRVLEVNVAGKMVSDMCRAAVKSNTKMALATFLPSICSVVINLASGALFLYS